MHRDGHCHQEAMSSILEPVLSLAWLTTMMCVKVGDSWRHIEMVWCVCAWVWCEVKCVQHVCAVQCVYAWQAAQAAQDISLVNSQGDSLDPCSKPFLMNE